MPKAGDLLLGVHAKGTAPKLLLWIFACKCEARGSFLFRNLHLMLYWEGPCKSILCLSHRQASLRPSRSVYFR
jgi:hypothetical protein